MLIGKRFIEKIVAFCAKFKLKMDNTASSSSSKSGSADTVVLPAQVEELLKSLSETKRLTYTMFQLERKPLDEIALKRGLVSSTLSAHLEEAFLIGLPLDFGRLGITVEAVNKFEARIRQPPINSSNPADQHAPIYPSLTLPLSSDVSKLPIIKEQIPEMSWDQLRFMTALLKFKYGAMPDDDELPVVSGGQQKLAVVRDQSPQDDPQPSTSSKLPEWLKRPPSDPDLKSMQQQQQPSSSQSNPKKKPKFGI